MIRVLNKASSKCTLIGHATLLYIICIYPCFVIDPNPAWSANHKHAPPKILKILDRVCLVSQSKTNDRNHMLISRKYWCRITWCPVRQGFSSPYGSYLKRNSDCIALGNKVQGILHSLKRCTPLSHNKTGHTGIWGSCHVYQPFHNSLSNALLE